MKKFRIFIVDDDRTDGGTVHVENGVVLSNAARVPQDNNPDGWEDISIGWERNITNFGVIRNFSLALGFVRNTAKILRKIFYTENIERKLSLLITMLTLDLTTTSFAFNYMFLYKGDLDFSTFQDDQPHKVTMNIMEGGISKLLKANEDAYYEIPFKNDPDAKDLYCDGIGLDNRVNYVATDGLTYDYRISIIDLPFIAAEGLSADIEHFSQTYEGVVGFTPELTTYRAASNNYFIINHGTQALACSLQGKVMFRINSVAWGLGTNHNLYLMVIDNLSTTYSDRYLIADPIIGQIYTVDLNLSTPFFGSTPDQRYFFVLQAGDLASDNAILDFEFLDGSTLTTVYSSRKAPSVIKFFTLYDYYRKLTGKITGSQDDAVSALLAQNLNIGITCGDAIRGFPTAKIRSKMVDLFQSVNVQFNAGMGIEGNKLTLERKAHYFDSSNPIHLGEAKSLKVTEANDLMFNTLKIGSAPQDYNDINGLQEFNNLTYFGSPITRVVKELNLESPYRRDSYGFEYTRINFVGKDSTDSDSDNDVWLVNTMQGPASEFFILYFGLVFETVAPNIIRIPAENVQVGPSIIISDSAANNGTYAVSNIDFVTGFTLVYTVEPLVDNTGSGNLYTNSVVNILKRGTYDTVEGLYSPTSVFNLEDMTIARLIEQHGNWIRSMMWGFDNYVLPFRTTDKNRELKTVKGSKIYDEDTDIIIKDLAAPLCIPKYFEIETKVPVNLPTLLENNPSKCFSFDWDGNTYKGFLMKAGISISDNAKQVFKLLSSADNDLSKLVV